MAMDAELKECFIYTVYAAQVVAKSKGVETLSTPVKLSAYVEELIDESGGAIGRDRNTSHEVWVDVADYEVTSNTRIWLPGRDQTDAKRALSAERINKLPDVENGGYSHFEVVL